MAHVATDSVFRRLVQRAREQGWTVDMTAKCHYRFRPPDRKQTNGVHGRHAFGPQIAEEP